MNEEEIKQAISVYINEKDTDYSVMLNGKWGSGKTFFVKNTLINYIQSKFSKPVIYNSLFGINTVDEFWEALALQIYDIKANEKGREEYCSQSKKYLPMKVLDNHRGAGVTAHIFKGIIDIFPKGKNINSVLSTMLQSTIDFSKYVYIFDDFERLGNNIDIKNIIGIIDVLANQCSAKVIVVCNESYFYKEDNLNNEATNDDKKNVNNILKIKDQYKDYNEFKEKFIGTTFDYRPNIEFILTFLINKCDEDLKLFLQDNIDIIKECLHVSKCINVRTIRFAIKRFGELRQKLIPIYRNICTDMKYSEKFFAYMLKSCFYTTISYKEHNKFLIYENGTLVQIAQFTEDGASKDFRYWSMINTYVSYKPLDSYLKSYLFNEDEFMKIIKQHIIDEINKFEEYTIPLKNMYKGTEEYALSCILSNLEKLKRNEIPINAYPKIIEPIFELSDVLEREDLKIECEALMLANIEKPGADFDCNQWFGSAGFLKHSNEAYWRLYKRMCNLDSSNKWCILNDILHVEKDFVLRLGEFLKSYESEMHGPNSCFLSNTDYKALAHKVVNLDTIELIEFREIIRKIYPDNLINIKECRLGDKDALIDFSKELKEQVKLKNRDKIWMVHFKYLSEYLNSIIEKLK